MKATRLLMLVFMVCVAAVQSSTVYAGVQRSAMYNLQFNVANDALTRRAIQSVQQLFCEYDKMVLASPDMQVGPMDVVKPSSPYTTGLLRFYLYSADNSLAGIPDYDNNAPTRIYNYLLKNDGYAMGNVIMYLPCMLGIIFYPNFVPASTNLYIPMLVGFSIGTSIENANQAVDTPYVLPNDVGSFNDNQGTIFLGFGSNSFSNGMTAHVNSKNASELIVQVPLTSPPATNYLLITGSGEPTHHTFTIQYATDSPD